MKNTNKLSVVVFLALAMGLNACSENKSAEQYIADGQVSLQERDYNKAIIQLKNVVKMTPENPQARMLLGKAYLEQGSYVNAEKELEKAAIFGYTDNMPVLIGFVKMKLNKYQEVLDLVDSSVDLPNNEYQLLLVYAGISSVQNNNIEQAQDFFTQAISLNENAVYGQLSKAYLAQTNNDLLGALNTSEAILLKNASLNEALLLKGNLQFGLAQYQIAAETFAKYIKQVPNAVYVRYFEVKSLIKAENFADAESRIDFLMAKSKNAPLASQYKAEIKFYKGNYADAKRFAEQAAQAGAQFQLAKMIAGISAYQLKDTEQAYFHLRALEQSVSDNHPIKRILAIVRLELGYTDEALQALDKLSDVDEEFLQLASEKLVLNDDMPSAVNLLIRAEQLSPDSAIIKVQKGRLMLSEGDANGIAALEQALNLDPSLDEVKTTLVLEYLKKGDDEKAKTVIEEKLSRDESQISGLLLRGVYYSKQKQYDEAKKSFEKILLVEPKNIAALYNLGLIAINEENYSMAVTYYQKVLLIHPSHQGAIQQLSQAHLESDKLSETVQFLTSLQQTHSNNLNVMLGLAQNLRQQGDVKQAITLLKNIDPQTTKPAGYWVILGDSYTQNREFEKASDTFTKALAQYPNHFVINLRKIATLELEKKYLEALQATNATYMKFPDNIDLQMLQGYYELLNKNYDAAEQRLNQLNNKKVSNSFIDNLAGQLALEQKKYELAVESFSQAYEKLPNRRNVISLARALKFNQQQHEAELLLTEYINDNPDAMAIKLLLANLYSFSDPQKSIEQYKMILQEQPDNVLALNNLAWGQYENDLPIQALANIEKAYEKQPHSILILETYGVILIENKKYNQGVKILNQAISKGSKDEYVQIALAQAFIAKNDHQQAQLILNQLFSTNKHILQKRKNLFQQIK
ncbi:MAG: XrtA/PEP-CTERM system TPR-repeat protein PrsT [Cognaticolwellia sp.]